MNRYISIAICFLLALLWSYPLWYTSGLQGTGDWGTSMASFESMRKSLLEYGQWPAHNPWTMGGIPVNVTNDLLSLQGVCVLACGTYWGVRIAIPLYMLIGLLGSWRLAGVIGWKNNYVKCVFALYTISNVALIHHVAGGHFCFHSFWYFPAIFAYVLSIRSDGLSGAKAGALMGLSFLESPVYVFQYGCLFAALLFIWECRHSLGNIARYIWWAVSCGSVFATFTVYRLLEVLPVVKDFPRITNYEFNYKAITILSALFYPHTGQYPPLDYSFPHCYCIAEGELGCYLGVGAFLLFVVSITWGVRWYHIAAIFIVLLWYSSGGIIDLAAVMKHIPSFESHLGFTRIRMFIPLFVGMAVAASLHNLLSRRPTLAKALVVKVFSVLMLMEVMFVGHLVMYNGNVKAPVLRVSNNTGYFINAGSLGSHGWVTYLYDAVHANIGWLRGYGPSYIGERSACVGAEEPGYIGEAVQNGRTVTPTYWSPNHLVFSNLTGSPVTINMNPGRLWHKVTSNGATPLWPEYRVMEITKSFVVTPEGDGTLDLVYIQPLRWYGLFATIILFFASVIIVVKIIKNTIKS